MRDTIGVHSTLTGEVLDGAQIGVFYPKRQVGYDGGWMALALKSLGDIAEDRTLNLTDHRVLGVLLSELDYENFLYIAQADVAVRLGVGRAAVNRSFKKLLDKRILLRGPKRGRVYTYGLNPRVGWRGQAQKGSQALQRAEQLKLTIVEGGRDDE